MQSSTCFNHRCEAIVIQMSRCHTKSKKALSADAMKDSWRSIFILSAAGDQQLAPVASLTPPPPPVSQLTVLDGCWCRETVVGIQRSPAAARADWIAAVTGATGASRCHCQCVGCFPESQNRPAQVWCWCAKAWKHKGRSLTCRCSLHLHYCIGIRSRTERCTIECTPTYICCIYMQISLLQNISIHILEHIQRHTQDIFSYYSIWF